MTLSKKIKRYRHIQKLTQQQFAAKAGLTRVLVNAIENEYNTNPTMETLIGLAAALETTIDELVKE